MEVDRIREGIVLFLPSDHFDHHGADPGFVHDLIMNGPAPSTDGFVHAGLTEGRGSVQSVKEPPSGLKPLIDLHHQFFSGSIEVADAFEFNGIMIGIGETIDEMNIEPGQEGFNEFHDLGKFMESSPDLTRYKAGLHGADFLRDISEFRTGGEKLRAVGEVDLKPL